MEQYQAAADALLDVRKTRERLSDLPAAQRPASLDDAYAVQDASLDKLGDSVGGWKVSPSVKKEGRFCSIVPSAQVFRSPANLPADKAFAPEIEVEIAVLLGSDLPPAAELYSSDDVRNAIASIHPAIEVLDSRFLDRKAQQPLVLVADMQSNAGIVYGEGLSDWQNIQFAQVSMQLSIDGAAAAKADGGPDTETVMTALTFLANHSAARNGGLKAGQVILTGARIKPTLLKLGATAQATLEGIGSVSLTYDLD